MVPYIRQVQIVDYKSFDRSAVNLEPFTVFVGPNGSGKSNFIDALSFVSDCLSESIERAVNKRGGLHAVRRARPGTGTTTGMRLVLAVAHNLWADYAFRIHGHRGEDFSVERERCAVHEANGEKYEFEVKKGEFVREIPGIRPKISANSLALFAASATEEFAPVYDFLTSMRFYCIVPDQLRGPLEPDSGLFLKRDGRNAAAVLRRITDKLAYEDLCLLLSKSVQGVGKVVYRPAEGKEKIVFEQDMGSERKQEFDAANMSDGTLRLLGLLLAVHQGGRHSVVAIEEPEATVHPAIAEMLTEVLMDAANERQILVTTHSPDILDYKELTDEQIRAVIWEEGRTLICPVSQASRDAIRERLYTPGELLRVDELSQDIDGARTMAKQVDLFGPPVLSDTEQK